VFLCAGFALFYSLGKTAKALFGSDYAKIKCALDAEYRAAVRKADNL
jgi:hypothetical protein